MYLSTIACIKVIHHTTEPDLLISQSDIGVSLSAENLYGSCRRTTPKIRVVPEYQPKILKSSQLGGRQICSTDLVRDGNFKRVSIFLQLSFHDL